MMMGSEFQGGVFSTNIEGGRAGARVHISSGAVTAQVTDMEPFSIPHDQAQVEVGGASGRMLFIRNTSKTLTIFSEAPGLIDSLSRVGNPNIQRQLIPIRAALRRHKRFSATMAAMAMGIAIILIAGTGWLISAGPRALIDVVPFSIDEQVGEFAIENMDVGGSPSRSAVTTEAVTAIIERLAPNTGIPDIDFKLKIIENEQVNAFALPGGQIVIFTGLIRRAESAEQVAGVLGHEIAHVTERHGLERMLQSVGIVATVQLVLGDVAGVLAVARDLLTLAAINSYSRSQEAEADDEAVRLLSASKIDPHALSEFFALMKADNSTEPSEEESKAEEDEEQGALEALSWMSTHPQFDERIEAIEEAARDGESPRFEPLPIDWKAVQSSLSAPETTTQENRKP